MKKLDWMMLALFAVAAAGLRAAQMTTGFDAEGLPLSGNLPGTLLPFALFAAAAYFVLTARKLPAQGDMTGALADHFLFQDMTAVTAAVAGSFLLLVSAAAAVMGYGSMDSVLPAAFAVAGAFSLLYAVFGLYRGNAVQGVVLLIPVCCLVAYLVCLYRADAVNPILADTYIEILAVSALTFSSLELASFGFLGGAPRVFLPACAMALVLSLAAAAERRSLAAALLYLGCALLELGFLAAADFRE